MAQTPPPFSAKPPPTRVSRLLDVAYKTTSATLGFFGVGGLLAMTGYITYNTVRMRYFPPVRVLRCPRLAANVLVPSLCHRLLPQHQPLRQWPSRARNDSDGQGHVFSKHTAADSLPAWRPRKAI
jgi:hypothetical protein